MTVPISMSEFPFYIIEKKKSLQSFSKDKKSQLLCHKRKLPSLIKFRNQMTKETRTEQSDTLKRKYACRKKNKTQTRTKKTKSPPLLTLNTGTWSDLFTPVI